MPTIHTLYSLQVNQRKNFGMPSPLSVSSTLTMATIYNELLIRFVRWFADAVRPCGFVLDNSVSLKNLDRGSAAAGGINVPETAKAQIISTQKVHYQKSTLCLHQWNAGYITIKHQIVWTKTHLSMWMLRERVVWWSVDEYCSTDETVLLL